MRFFPYPVLECILDGLLFLLGKRGLFFVENTLLLSVCVLNRVVDTHIPKIQRIFQNPIGIGTAGTVGHISMNIIFAQCALSGNLPFRSHGRKLHFDASAHIKRRLKGLFHEILNIPSVNPCCTKPHINLRGFQIFRLRLLQVFHIDGIGGIFCGRQLSNTQFFSHIAGKVFVCGLPAAFFLVPGHGVLEDHALQFLLDDIKFSRRVQKHRHIRQIHPSTFSNGNG